MKKFLSAVGVAAALMLGGVSSAAASLIDFTDQSVFTTKTSALATGQSGGVYFRVTSSPVGELTFNDGGDAPGPVGPLAGEGDGLGVRSDESGPNQFLLVEFFEDAALSTAATIKLTGAYFLDLFKGSDADEDPESVFIYNGAPPSPANLVYGPINAEQKLGKFFGFKYESGLSLNGSVFAFDSGTGNDEAGVRDFALAGLEISAVPLPAGFLLLGSALAGLGVASRRRKTA